MLPTPFINYIPKIFQSDPKAIALATKMDSYLSTWGQDILNIRQILIPEQIPGSFISELGFLLAVTFGATDTETQRRQKIWNAVVAIQNRGTWLYDMKVTLDLLTGFNSAMWGGAFTDDWILVGDGVTEYSTNYWASMGADGIDSNLGIGLIGDGTEWEITGNIFINLHLGLTTPQLTTPQVAAIVAQITVDKCPAYMRVTLGYVDGSGNFIIYTGGTIG